MVAFIDAHREAYGVEPICVLLPIAPSTYLAGPARRRGPPRRPPDPVGPRLAALTRQLAAAIKRAERAEAIIEVQNKVAELLGAPLPPTASS